MAKKRGTQQATSRTRQPQRTADAVALLKNDHRTVEGLFNGYASAASIEEKTQLVRQICTELTTHTALEEEIFYPACREQQVEDALLDEAQVEHDAAKILIAELMALSPQSEFYDAKMKVLSEYIKHHVGEEEKASGIFAKAKKAGIDMSALGQRLQARQQELKQQAEITQGSKGETPGFGLLQPRALEFPFPFGRSNFQEQRTMARQYNRDPSNRDRDEQGRFMSEDDRGDSGRSARGGGRYEREDDNGYGSRGGRSRSNERERDEQGRFMSDEDDGRSSGRGSGRGRDDDDYGSSRGRGQGGWFGDSEGHSRASQQGWEERGSSRSSRGDDYEDRGRSSNRGSSRDDDDYGSSRGRGQGGWFGDPEGHSRASQQGWEERGSGSGRSRDRDDEDNRRGSRSGGSDQRGWFGDPRGHSEAARRGWQQRE